MTSHSLNVFSFDIVDWYNTNTTPYSVQSTYLQVKQFNMKGKMEQWELIQFRICNK